MCKCIDVTGNHRGIPKLAPLITTGHPLPWFERADQVGHTINESGMMEKDIEAKRAQFAFGQCLSLHIQVM